MIAEGRAAQWAANRRAQNIPTSEMEKEAFKRVMVQDLLEQRKQRTSTAFNPETQRVETVPGTKFQTIEEATTSTDLPKQAQAFMPAKAPAGVNPGGGVTPLREGGTAKEKLTTEEYKGFTGSSTAMELLNVMSENVETTGPIVGPLKEFAQRNSLMTPDGTLDFALAKARLDNLAQEIIKGIPSNFDVQTFQKTLAKVGEDPEANKRAIQQGARQLARAMAEQIDYAKRFNKELPDQSLETARQFGVDVDGILSGKSKQQIALNKPLGIKLDPYTPDSAKAALAIAQDKKNKGKWMMWKGNLRPIQ